MKELLAVALLNCCLACSASGADAGRARDADLAAAGAAADSSGGGGAVSVSADWCAARTVIEAKCQRCHASPAQHGAPFPLVTYEDTQVVNRRGEPRFVHIEAVVAEGFMPPSFITLDPEVEPLSALERAQLLDWCRAGGLPAAAEACEPL